LLVTRRIRGPATFESSTMSSRVPAGLTDSGKDRFCPDRPALRRRPGAAGRPVRRQGTGARGKAAIVRSGSRAAAWRRAGQPIFNQSGVVPSQWLAGYLKAPAWVLVHRSATGRRNRTAVRHIRSEAAHDMTWGSETLWQRPELWPKWLKVQLCPPSAACEAVDETNKSASSSRTGSSLCVVLAEYHTGPSSMVYT